MSTNDPNPTMTFRPGRWWPKLRELEKRQPWANQGGRTAIVRAALERFFCGPDRLSPEVWQRLSGLSAGLQMTPDELVERLLDRYTEEFRRSL